MMPSLGRLVTRPIIVTSRVDGSTIEATLWLCPCGREEWIVFTIGAEQHKHLQCAACGETYCDGTCGAS